MGGLPALGTARSHVRRGSPDPADRPPSTGTLGPGRCPGLGYRLGLRPVDLGCPTARSSAGRKAARGRAGSCQTNKPPGQARRGPLRRGASAGSCQATGPPARGRRGKGVGRARGRRAVGGAREEMPTWSSARGRDLRASDGRWEPIPVRPHVEGRSRPLRLSRPGVYAGWRGNRPWFFRPVHGPSPLVASAETGSAQAGQVQRP
jgi:hypothetical protein